MKKLILLTGIALQLSAMAFAQGTTVQYSDSELIRIDKYIKKLEQKGTDLHFNRTTSANQALTQNPHSILKQDNATYSEKEIIELVNYIKVLENQQNIYKKGQKTPVITENGFEIASHSTVFKVSE